MYAMLLLIVNGVVSQVLPVDSFMSGEAFCLSKSEQAKAAHKTISSPTIGGLLGPGHNPTQDDFSMLERSKYGP
jgi:hypothetical protein